MSKNKILPGEKFGRLSVIKEVEERRDGCICYLCKCDCGTEKIISSRLLRNGSTKSCGCYNRDLLSIKRPKQKIIDLVGMRFGRLTVTEMIPERKYGRQVQWKCVCDCGAECVVRGVTLKSGHKKSCGCVSQSLRKKNFEAATGLTYNKDERLVFLNGDTTDFSPENLCVTNRWSYTQMRDQSLFFDNPELTQTAIMACELSHKARVKLSDLNNSQKVDEGAIYKPTAGRLC